MTRNFFIQAHLLVAAFFTPVILLMAVSGGLYLLGVKGNTSQSIVTAPAGASIDLKSEVLENDVRTLLGEVAPGYSFEYLKVKGDTLYTRPTSTLHYELKVSGSDLSIYRNEPSLQKSLVELHKGHGPTRYKSLQKIMAGGLIFVLLSGMWLGLSSRVLRGKTLSMLVIGAVMAAALVVL